MKTLIHIFSDVILVYKVIFEFQFLTVSNIPKSRSNSYSIINLTFS